jgi:hypothetical protein
MGVLDLFSGKSGRNAAIWSAGNTASGLNQQRSDLTGGADLSLAALATGARDARLDINREYSGALGSLATGRDQSVGVLNANPALIKNYGAAADKFYAPLGAEANRGFSVYGDAAGVNGAAGQNRARENFRAGPGYEFMVNQGVNAATRAANATGMGASGNTLDATTRLGANLADQEWDDYMSRLNPYLNVAPTIAGKRADIQTGMSNDLIANNAALAGVYTGAGNSMAAARMGKGNTLASLASGLGSNQAGIYGDLSKNLSNVTGAATAQTTNAGQAGLLAGQTANANTWNAGMQLANLAVDAAGKFKNPFG